MKTNYGTDPDFLSDRYNNIVAYTSLKYDGMIKSYWC